MAAATELSDRTIRTGISELGNSPQFGSGRQRKISGGRETRTEEQPDLLDALDQLINHSTRGDPMNPLRWTCKSTRTLAQELRTQGYNVGPTTIRGMLHKFGYSLQANRKTHEGKEHPNRGAQFQHINKRVKARKRRGVPAISVDTKKKENLGNKKNPGKTYEHRKKPREVDSHVFPNKGKAVPYGVYDIHQNKAAVSVGISHDTAEFAVTAIRRWWI